MITTILILKTLFPRTDAWINLKQKNGLRVFEAKIQGKTQTIGIFLGNEDASVSQKSNLQQNTYSSFSIEGRDVPFRVTSKHTFDCDIVLGRNSFKDSVVVFDFISNNLGILNSSATKESGFKVDAEAGKFSVGGMSYWLPNTTEVTLVKPEKFSVTGINLSTSKAQESAEDGVATLAIVNDMCQVVQGSQSQKTNECPIPGVSLFGKQRVEVDLIENQIKFSVNPKFRCAEIISMVTGLKLDLVGFDLVVSGHVDRTVESRLSDAGLIQSKVEVVPKWDLSVLKNESDFFKLLSTSLRYRAVALCLPNKRVKYEY